jgi:hypothetical protein
LLYTYVSFTITVLPFNVVNCFGFDLLSLKSAAVPPAPFASADAAAAAPGTRRTWLARNSSELTRSE